MERNLNETVYLGDMEVLMEKFLGTGRIKNSISGAMYLVLGMMGVGFRKRNLLKLII